MLKIENVMEMDEALDGQAKWLVCIVNAYVNKYQGFSECPEDFFQDFLVCYLKNRHKYDPARASRSHWTFWLFRSWAWRRRQSQKRLPKFTQKEADTFQTGVQLDADETALIDCCGDFRGRISVATLARRAGLKEREVESRLDSIRHKVSNRRAKVIVRN
jgi:hypothetical protein